MFTCKRHGFRLKHSHETQLVQTVDFGREKHMSQSLTLRRHFDATLHSWLISMLESYRTNLTCIRWIDKRLTNRRQMDIFDGVQSKPAHRMFGGPQGMIFCRTFKRRLSYSLMTVWCSEKSIPTKTTRYRRMTNWTKNWLMRLNVKKY